MTILELKDIYQNISKFLNEIYKFINMKHKNTNTFIILNELEILIEYYTPK